MKIMENDLYTKIILTVIAACLLISLFKSSFSLREATAQKAQPEKAQPVYAEGGHVTVDGIVDVNEVRSDVTVRGTVNVSSPYKYLERGEDFSDVVNVRVVNP